jgi:hypothetical protein
LKSLLDNAAMNDFRSHNIKVKILPAFSASLQASVMNNSNYREEIFETEIERFGYDRIYNNAE